MEAANDALYSLEKIPDAVWVENFQGSNIVNMMVLTGQEDFEITSFLLTGSEYERVCGICAEAGYGVTVSGCSPR